MTATILVWIDVSTTAWRQVALEREEAAEEQSVQYLDLEGETDEDGNSLEEEFEEEKGRRSLASIFESDEEDVLQVDANLQDETLLVPLLLLLIMAEYCGWQHGTEDASHRPFAKHTQIIDRSAGSLGWVYDYQHCTVCMPQTRQPIPNEDHQISISRSSFSFFWDTPRSLRPVHVKSPSFRYFQNTLLSHWQPLRAGCGHVQVENIGLSDVTINALHGRNVKALFPIQKHVFDPAMEGRDLVARAKTGSGKTLAFSLPVIESLLKVVCSLLFAFASQPLTPCFPVQRLLSRLLREQQRFAQQGYHGHMQARHSG